MKRSRMNRLVSGLTFLLGFAAIIYAITLLRSIAQAQVTTELPAQHDDRATWFLVVGIALVVIAGGSLFLRRKKRR